MSNLVRLLKRNIAYSNFRKQYWREPYVRLKQEKRQTARNKLEEKLFNFTNNSSYGKTCESKSRRMQLTLAQNAAQVLENVSSFTFKTFKIFGRNLFAVKQDPKRIYWDKPTTAGATILDLAKLQVYRFHYTKTELHFQNTAEENQNAAPFWYSETYKLEVIFLFI